MRKLFILFLSFFLLSCSKTYFGSVHNALPKPPTLNIDDDLTPTVITENFQFQFLNNKLDILVVVDNSASMYEEQKKMGQRLSSFTDQLHNVDWQLAITTTDVYSNKHGLKGEFLEFSKGETILTPKTKNYKQKFLDTVVRSETVDFCLLSCPSNAEEPLTALKLSIEKSKRETRKLFRKDAHFITIILTDEDQTDASVNAEDILETIHAHLGPKKKFAAYGILVLPNDKHCLKESGSDARYGHSVYDLIQKTQGLAVDICAPNYGDSLSRLGEEARKLTNYVTLSRTPRPESLYVEVFPKLPSLKYRLDGKKVIIETLPSSIGSSLHVSYEPL